MNFKDRESAYEVRNVNFDLIKTIDLTLPENANKGSNGTLNIIAGSPEYRGAADLCVGGAMRTGCGIVRLISAETVIQTVSVRHPGCTFAVTGVGQEVKDVIYRNRNCTGYLIGCGIGKSSGSAEAVDAVLSEPKQKVLDADALNIISLYPDLKKRLCGSIVTPHPGEFCRLSGYSMEEVKSEPEKCALRFSADYGTITVLKDYVTYIATPEGESFRSQASRGLSKGGSGDVLAGMIAGFAARGFSAADAAVAGLWLHAESSYLCEEKHGKMSMLPQELELFAAEAAAKAGL